MACVGPIAGAAVSVAGNALFGGGSQGQQTTQASSPNVPSWLLPYLQTNAATASTLAATPYTPYTGNQVAQLTGLQNQAAGLAAALPGQAQVGFNQANQIQSNVAQQGLNGLNPQTIQNYMNPYTQAVMNASQQRQLQQYQLEQNALQANQGQVGAFGGSRAALAQGQLASNFEQQLSQNEATQLQNNFTNAENMGMQGLGQANTAAQGIMQGAAAGQTATLQNIGALQTAGGLQQQTQQAGLNAAYQNFLTQQAYPYQNLANSQNILNPIASLVTGTNATGFTQQSGSPGIGQQILGGAAIGNAIANGSSSNSFGFGNIFGSNNITASTPSSSFGFNSSNSYSPPVDTSSSSGIITSGTGFAGGGLVGKVPHTFTSSPPGFARGGMAHSMYAEGGQVHAGIPTLKDHIDHFIDSYAQSFDAGGLVMAGRMGYGYASGGQVKSGIPGVPTQYGLSAEEMPYTNQKPRYDIPAYAKGGQIPLTSGLSSADIGGVKRERRAWGKPYVAQDPAAKGYLRPNIPGTGMKEGGLVHYGIPHFDDGGAVDPTMGAALADAQLNNSYTPVMDIQKPSLVDAMINKATDRTAQEAQIEQGKYAPAAAYGTNLPAPDTVMGRRGIPLNQTVGGLPINPDMVNATAAAVDHPSLATTSGTQSSADDDENDRIAHGLFKTLTGADKPGSVVAVAKAIENMPFFEAGDQPSRIGQIGADISAATGNAGLRAAKGVSSLITAPSDIYNYMTEDTRPSAQKATQAQAATQAMGGMRAQYNNQQMQQSNAQQKQIADQITANTVTPENITQSKQTGVNLPLLAMGAAILGNRSNSLAGAIGAGGEAYVGAAEKQLQYGSEQALREAQTKWYGQRGDIAEAKVGPQIADLNAKAARENQMAAAGGKTDMYNSTIKSFMEKDLMYSTDPNGAYARAKATADRLYPNHSETGTASAALPTVTSQAMYDALPAGASYMDTNQQLHIKQ